MKIIAVIAFGVFLTGCAATEYQPIEQLDPNGKNVAIIKTNFNEKLSFIAEFKVCQKGIVGWATGDTFVVKANEPTVLSYIAHDRSYGSSRGSAYCSIGVLATFEAGKEYSFGMYKISDYSGDSECFLQRSGQEGKLKDKTDPLVTLKQGKGSRDRKPNQFCAKMSKGIDLTEEELTQFKPA